MPSADSKGPNYLSDFHPKNWLSKYQKTSVLYLLKMAIFYHVIGLGLMILASILVNQLIPDYETPDLPVSIAIALSSGPAEEILFFGLPFYVSGNPFLVLITGAIWSLLHIFNTETITPNSLAYSGFLFTIPHIFFSLRTWIRENDIVIIAPWGFGDEDRGDILWRYTLPQVDWLKQNDHIPKDF